MSWRWKCQKSWRVTLHDWLFSSSILAPLIGMIYLVTVYWHISLNFSLFLSLSLSLLSILSSVAFLYTLILLLNSLSLPVNVIWRFQNEIYRTRQNSHSSCKPIWSPKPSTIYSIENLHCNFYSFICPLI